MEFLFLSIIFLIGSCLGSFGACIGSRLFSDMKNKLLVPSMCFGCNNTLRIRDLIPVLSFILQKGHCRYCKIKIPSFCILSELYMGISSVVFFYLFNVDFAILCVAINLVLLIQVISDLEYGLLSDLLTGVFGLFGIIVSIMLNRDLESIIQSIGMIIFIFGVSYFIVKRIKKEDPLGFGDIKIFLLLPLFFDFNRIITFSFGLGVLSCVFCLAFKKKCIPLMPSIMVSFWMNMLYDFVNLYYKVLKKSFILLSCVILFGCSYDGEIDKLMYSSYKDAIDKAGKLIATEFQKVELDFIDGVIIPDKPSMLADKKITISATEEMPLIDLLLQVASLTEINIQIDPGVIGSMIISAKNISVRDLFDRISQMNDVRYSEKNGIVFFEQDLPYAKTYIVDFLDVTRSSSGSLSLATAVVSQAGSSSTSVSSSSEDGFWTSLNADIIQIVQSTESIYDHRAKLSNAVNRKKQNSSSDDESSDEPVGTGDDLAGGMVGINKRAGILTLTATQKAHDKVEEYLRYVKNKVSSQVLVEMKFVEVSLNDTYAHGIRWGNPVSSGNVNQFTLASALGNSVTPVGTLTGSSGSLDLEYTVNLLSTFGTTRVLSSPRINAINNQPALLTFADNDVYFEVNVDIVPAQVSNGTTISERTTLGATSKSLPVGVIMSVIPSIDLEKNEILLSVRPTVSYIKERVADPSVAWLAKDSSSTNPPANLIPVTTVRELDSMLKMRNGGIMAIGGFTKRDTKVTEIGLPVLSKIPILGYLFKNRSRESVTQEMVILIKATIINNDNMDVMYNFDKEIYNQFSDGPRI